MDEEFEGSVKRQISQDLPVFTNRSGIKNRPIITTTLCIFVDTVDKLFYVAAAKMSKCGDQPGKWYFPTGKLEWDEHPVDSAIRNFWTHTSVYAIPPALKKTGLSIIHESMVEPFCVTTDLESGDQGVHLFYGLSLTGDRPKLAIPRFYPEFDANTIDEVKWVDANAVTSLEWAYNHDGIGEAYLLRMVREVTCF